MNNRVGSISTDSSTLQRSESIFRNVNQLSFPTDQMMIMSFDDGLHVTCDLWFCTCEGAFWDPGTLPLSYLAFTFHCTLTLRLAVPNDDSNSAQQISETMKIWNKQLAEMLCEWVEHGAGWGSATPLCSTNGSAASFELSTNQRRGKPVEKIFPLLNVVVVSLDSLAENSHFSILGQESTWNPIRFCLGVPLRSGVREQAEWLNVLTPKKGESQYSRL